MAKKTAKSRKPSLQELERLLKSLQLESRANRETLSIPGIDSYAPSYLSGWTIAEGADRGQLESGSKRDQSYA